MQYLEDIAVADKSFATLQVANAFLGDFNQLETFFQDQGYLFFQGVLGLEDVLRVKADFIRVLQEQGVVESGGSEPMWTGACSDHLDDNALYSLDSYIRLFESPCVRQLVEKVFGEPVLFSPNIHIRYSVPEDDEKLAPLHQDYAGYGKGGFRTMWLPLVDIDERTGPLVIAAGSHKYGLLDHAPGGVSYIFRGRKFLSAQMEDVPGTWILVECQPGDALIFHNLLVHGGAPNRSDRVRLSLDNRYQTKCAPRMWELEKSILDLRRYRRDVRWIASEEGAGETLFEAVLIEMNRRKLPPERAHVKALMEELK